jgi:hypothetical protein
LTNLVQKQPERLQDMRLSKALSVRISY